jgi:replicative DNA helicase
MGTDHIEKAILGYMIIDSSLDSKLLNAKYFTVNQNKTIYRAIRNLKREGKATDLTMVTQYLDDNGLLASGMKTGVEVNYLSSLGEGLILGSTAEHHFKIHVNELIATYKQREALKVLAAVVKGPDPSSAIMEIKKILAGFELESIEPIESLSIASHTEKFTDHILKKRAGEFWGHKIKRFPKLTNALMGIREIIVLAAQPKVGKSTFVLQVASEVAAQGPGVIYYDFENGRYNLMAREACRKFGIKYRAQLLNDVVLWSDIADKINSMSNVYNNFAIITDRRLSIDRIRSHILNMRRTIEQEHILIVIDSLQKLPMKDLRDRRAAIDRWLRDFEELKAEDPNLAILMVSELSREGQKPKESGDIEYTGHFLLRFERNQAEEDLLQHEDDCIRNLWIEYARDVATGGPIKYKADFEYWRFEELSGKFGED